VESAVDVDDVALAERLGYQTDYLNRIFKQATGQTQREYRDARVIKKARRLLRESRRVKDVCEVLGFPDQNDLARWFNKFTGVPPSRYAGAAGDGNRPRSGRPPGVRHS
jgi:AraC-like DNA-binding protein